MSRAPARHQSRRVHASAAACHAPGSHVVCHHRACTIRRRAETLMRTQHIHGIPRRGCATALAASCPRRAALRRRNEPGLDATRAAIPRRSPRPWADMNVPEVDGQTLHDIIVARKYTSALEIGTSTGHSGIWIAWALSKNGGKAHHASTSTRGVARRRWRTSRPGRRRAVHRLAPGRRARPRACARAGRSTSCSATRTRTWYPNYFDALLPKLTRAAATRRTTCRPDRADGTTSTSSTC